MRGPVVLVQHDHSCVREHFLELEDVADVRAAEAVDRLVGVADYAHVLVLLAEQHHEFVLRLVRVLVLVDHDVRKAGLPFLQSLLVDLHEVHGDHQQVVEVHRVGGGEAALVLVVGGRDELALGRRLGLLGVSIEVDQFVLRRAYRVQHAARGVSLRIDALVAQHIGHEAQRVGIVVDGEAAAVAEAVGVAAQDAHAGRVERGDPHLVGDGPDQRADAVAHLVGGLVGEGDRQNRPRRRVLLADQPRDAVGQHPRLA